MSDAPPDDDHVEVTVQRMADLHAEGLKRVSTLQRNIAALTLVIGTPRTLAATALAVAAWVTANLAAPRFGLAPFDAPPFPVLELIATVAALFTTLMILATQRMEEAASRRRSQLTLQLASLSEQKIAKVIELLQAQRRDSPQLETLVDPQAEEMSRPADPRHVLDRIERTHEG